jgi:hypothetical protein
MSNRRFSTSSKGTGTQFAPSESTLKIPMTEYRLTLMQAEYDGRVDATLDQATETIQCAWDSMVIDGFATLKTRLECNNCKQMHQTPTKAAEKLWVEHQMLLDEVDPPTMTETRLENVVREMERIELIYLRDVRGTGCGKH